MNSSFYMSFFQKSLLVIVSIVFISFLFWSIRAILTPFVLGVLFAYLLNPIANKLEKIGFSRLWATLAITTVFCLILILLLAVIIPALYFQLTAFIKHIPEYSDKIKSIILSKNDGFIEKIYKSLDINPKDLHLFFQNTLKSLLSFSKTIFSSLLSHGLAFIQIISLIVVTPVVTFYFLLDWPHFIRKLYQLLPPRYLPTAEKLLGNIDGVMAAFIRGQGSVCVILGIFYATSLSLAGLSSGLTLGLIIGLVSFIPYLGAFCGATAAIILTVGQFGMSYEKLLIVIVIFCVGQFLEGNYLSPKLVGEQVGLHPLWVIFALFFFGAVFGFVGVLLALPVSAAFGVIVRFIFDFYRKSNFYESAS